MEIEVNTEQIENAIEKVQELADTLDELSPKIIIGNPKDCTFNFYVSDKR